MAEWERCTFCHALVDPLTWQGDHRPDCPLAQPVSDCPHCSHILELYGYLPVTCPTCGRNLFDTVTKMRYNS